MLASLTLISVVAACGAGRSTMASENTEKNKQTVRRIYEEYINNEKKELLPELVVSDYVGPDGARGAAAFATIIERLRQGMPDIRFAIDDVLAEDDRVAIRWKWSGTHTGTIGGLAPTNRRVENEGIGLYQVREGKITRAWLQTDRLGFLQQIGAVPATLGQRPAE